jgi:lysophospholipase L1-like esterase
MMKQGMIALLLLAGAPASAQPAQAQDWANVDRYREANRSLRQADPGRVVFMGDSITEGWGKEPFIGDNSHFVDRGISGQTAPQMLVRFMADVVALNPAVVHIMAGTNDIAQNTGPETEAEMMGYIVSMAQLAHANHVRVIIGAIPPASDFPWRRGLHPATAIKALNARLKAYAERQGYIYADYWSALASEDGGLKSQYSDDGVHPNAAGYEAMRPIAQAAIARAIKMR